MKKHIIVLLGFSFISISSCLAHDHIILRNGRESDVKLHQITDDKIVFSHIGDDTGNQQEIPSKDVYMVYIEKQGNVYMKPDGKRFTGESKRADTKRNDIIYLVKGGEIAANNVRITENSIQYSIRIKKNAWGTMGQIEESLEKPDVFMIKYRSGMTDIITPIEVVEEPDSVKKETQPQFTVVFHAVKRGENLEKIAAKYSVTVEQIVEWNELSPKTKPTSPLTAGTQLMIYQSKN